VQRLATVIGYGLVATLIGFDLEHRLIVLKVNIRHSTVGRHDDADFLFAAGLDEYALIGFAVSTAGQALSTRKLFHGFLNEVHPIHGELVDGSDKRNKAFVIHMSDDDPYFINVNHHYKQC